MDYIEFFNLSNNYIRSKFFSSIVNFKYRLTKFKYIPIFLVHFFKINGNSSPLYPLDNQKIDLRTRINDL